MTKLHISFRDPLCGESEHASLILYKMRKNQKQDNMCKICEVATVFCADIFAKFNLHPFIGLRYNLLVGDYIKG